MSTPNGRQRPSATIAMAMNPRPADMPSAGATVLLSGVSRSFGDNPALRDLDRSLAFVDAAAAAGFDSVKFQLFKVRELFAPEILAKRPELLTRERWELPVSFLPPLAKRAKEAGIPPATAAANSAQRR